MATGTAAPARTLRGNCNEQHLEVACERLLRCELERRLLPQRWRRAAQRARRQRGRLRQQRLVAAREPRDGRQQAEMQRRAGGLCGSECGAEVFEVARGRRCVADLDDCVHRCKPGSGSGQGAWQAQIADSARATCG